MWATKAKALLLSAALLLAAGCGAAEAEQQDLSGQLADSTLAEKKTTYRTQLAEPQTLLHTAELSAEPSYRLIQPLRTGGSSLILQELLVSRGDRVEAGQPIAVLRGVGSPADVQQKELEIAALRANIEERLALYDEQLEQAQAQRSGSAELRELRVQYAETERAIYALQSENQLQAQEAALEALRAAVGETVLYAPLTGTIRTFSSKYKPGDVVPAYTELASLYGEDSLLLYGTSSSGSFVYGREVTVRLGRGEKERAVQGRVVSSPEVSPPQYYSNGIFVRVDPAELEGRRVTANMELRYVVLEDALVVPKTAITTEDGRAYLTLLEGEATRQRCVVRGPTAGTQVAILQGLQAGAEVVISSFNS